MKSFGLLAHLKVSIMTRTLALTLSLVLAGSGVSYAGFTWRMPAADTPSSDSVTYEVQAEATTANDTTPAGRAWYVDPSIPSVENKNIAATRFDMNNNFNGNPAFPEVSPAGDPGVGGTAPSVLSSDNGMPPAMIAGPGVSLTHADDREILASTSSPAGFSTQSSDSAHGVEEELKSGAVAVLRNNTVMSVPRYSAGDRPITQTAHIHQPDRTAAAPQLSSEEAETATIQPPLSQPIAIRPIYESVADTSPRTPTAPQSVQEPVYSQNAPISLITGQPMSVPGMVPAPQQVASQAITANIPNAGVVDGFGKQVPLVVALRQILPERYSFAHGDGVDLSQSVDWNGGRPWPEVLQSALGSIGLSAVITADTILIERTVQRAAVGNKTAELSAIAPAAGVDN